MFARVLIAAVLIALVWAVAARSSSGAGEPRVRVVKPGETLWSIATSRYDGDPRRAVWELRERNGLDDALLRPGQRLILPQVG